MQTSPVRSIKHYQPALSMQMLQNSVLILMQELRLTEEHDVELPW